VISSGTIVALEANQCSTHFTIRGLTMLFTIAIVLLILWALGFFVVHIGGGLIHVLLVIALIVIVYRLVTGQRVA
jgi:hypothetical protein